MIFEKNTKDNSLFLFDVFAATRARLFDILAHRNRELDRIFNESIVTMLTLTLLLLVACVFLGAHAAEELFDCGGDDS